MTSDEKRFVAGGVAWLAGCLGLLFGTAAVLSAAFAVAVKVYRLIVH